MIALFTLPFRLEDGEDDVDEDDEDDDEDEDVDEDDEDEDDEEPETWQVTGSNTAAKGRARLDFGFRTA